MAYNLLINGLYWGYNPLTNLLTNFLGHPSTCMYFNNIFLYDSYQALNGKHDIQQ